MSTFPIKYTPQENSTITKYYQVVPDGVDVPSDPHLEREILLNHMLQQKTSKILDLTGEITDFNKNLIISDVNCSINNPTAFCFSSKYVEIPPTEHYFHNPVVGINDFKETSNNALTSKIELDESNSPIFDTDLLITITDGSKQFNNKGESLIWTAKFGNNNNQLLQIASNSGYYGGIPPLYIEEDTSFNINYALGKLQNNYYIENVTTQKLESRPLDSQNLLSTNKITIDVYKDKFDDFSFGTYKIEQLESTLDVEYKNSDNNNTNNIITNNYIITGENDTVSLSSINTLSKYTDLTLDYTENNSIQIKITKIEPNSGLNLQNNIYNSYFSFDNSTMVNNNNFMEQIIYPKAQMQIEIKQNPMTITPEDDTITITSEVDYFTLSTNGETLTDEEYNQNGKICLQVLPNNERYTIMPLSETIPSSTNYKEITVDYSTLSDNLKKKENVEYVITNLVGPTTAYLNVMANNVADNSGLFTAPNLSNHTNFELTNSHIKELIDPNDENIVMIKVEPLTTYTFDSNNNYLYILNSNDNISDVVTKVKIQIEIYGNNINSLLNYDDLRFNISSRKVSDVFLDTTFYKISENNLLTEPNTSETNQWTIGYSDNNNSLITSLKTSGKTYNSTRGNIQKFIVNFYMALDEYNGNYDYIEEFKFSDPLNVDPNIITKSRISWTMKPLENTVTTYKFFKVSGSEYNELAVLVKTQVNYFLNVTIGYYENITLKTPTITLIEEYQAIFDTFTTIENENDYTYQISPDESKVFKVSGSGETTDVTNSRVGGYTKRYFNLNPESTTEIIINNPLTLEIDLTAYSSKPVFFNLEGRNKINNGYSNWSQINEKLPINPYFTHSTKNNINKESIVLTTKNTDSDYTISLTISFGQANNNFFFDKTYFLPLKLNNEIKSTIITGYKYGINNLKDPAFPEDGFVSFNPNYFVPNPLLTFGTSITEKLKFDITYNTPNEKEGKANTKSKMIIKYDDQILAQIDIDSPYFNSPIVLCRNSKYLFSVNRIIDNDIENKLHYRLFGVNELNEAHKGTITLYNDTNNTERDGVIVKYEGIQLSDSIKFILNPDKISVQIVGTESFEPIPIDSLEYNQVGSETLKIPYYRGYAFSKEQVTPYFYNINRKDLVSYKITATNEDTQTTFSSDTNKPHLNSTYTITFDKTIGSVGATITPLFSRLPKNLVTSDGNTSLNILMKVTSDEVTITRTILGNATVKTKLLEDYNLHTFENGKKLKALKLNVSPESELNDYYSLTYKKSDTKIFYSNEYIGNPLNISIFSNQFQFAFSDAKLGIRFNNEGSATNGYFKLTVTNETIPGTTSYFVVSPPYLAVSQNGVDILRKLQNIQSSDFDITKKIQKYFPVISQNQSTKYNPFAGRSILIGREWVNTLKNYIFNNDNDFKQQYNPTSNITQPYYAHYYQYDPAVVVLSGNGNVYYTYIVISYSIMTIRSSYVNDEWVKEYFLYDTNVSGISKTSSLTYNSTGHYIPVASSYDGNTVLLTKGGGLSGVQYFKCQVVSYSNGNLQKLGNEITFVIQSNYNLVYDNGRNFPTADITYGANFVRFNMTSDGSKLILIAQGGINTLVFNSGTNNWDLLPPSSDIKSTHFTIKQYYNAAAYSAVSANGMWMALLNDLPSGLEINIFKFDTTINNWVFFKKTPNYGSQIFIANNGDMVTWYTNNISRYAYDIVTQEYILKGSITGDTVGILNQFSVYLYSVCASADCNTVFFRFFNGLETQMIKKINFINNAWVQEQLPTSVFPIYTSNNGLPGIGRLNRWCLCSDDGSTLLTIGTTPQETNDEYPTNNIYKFKEIYQSELDAPLNDITFTQKFTKTYQQYESNPASPTSFDITGSTIEIKEVKPSGIEQTDNGPDNNGIIFSGSITELLDMPTSNKYYNSIKLNQSVTEITHLMLSYTQKYNGVSFYSQAQPINNIHFNIDGFFIPNGTYRLNSSTNKASKLSIYDMIKRDLDIVLLKYDCEAIDYTNIPKDTMIREINFRPKKVYKSYVQMPVRTFGDKYSDVFTSINQSKMTLSNNDVVWTEIIGNESTFLLDKFSLKISSINNDGLKNIVECLYTTDEIITNFTVVNQTNAFEILATDNTPLMIISPFGQISTSKMNTKELTFFDNASNNVELFAQIEIQNS